MPFTHLAVGALAAAETTVDDPTGFFGALADGANWFIGLFNAGGERSSAWSRESSPR